MYARACKNYMSIKFKKNKKNKFVYKRIPTEVEFPTGM